MRQDSDGSPTGDQQDADRRGVDVPTAAKRLGITPDAVRGRLHRGTLFGIRHKNGQWTVYLDPEPDPVEPDRPPAGAQQDATGDRQAGDGRDDGALVPVLLATIEDLRAQLERRDDELRRRDVHIQALIAKLPDPVTMLPAELEATGYRQARPVESPASPGREEAPAMTHEPSWIASAWHRFRRRS